MKHLFLIDDIKTFHRTKDTTLAFMTAVQERGGTVWGATMDLLWGKPGKAVVRATHYTVDMQQDDFYKAGDTIVADLTDFDVVWMRKDPPFNMQYINATYLLDLVDPQKTLVVNRPQGLRTANEKAFILQFPKWITDTAIARDREDIRALVDEFGGRAVIKPLDRMGGEGIFVLKADDGNFNSIVDAVTLGGVEHVMIQRFLPDAALGDKRILLIDGKPLGAILRVPQGKDFRGNMAVGGVATKVAITDREHEMIKAIGPRLSQEGLYFVGLDIIGGYMTEVNVTSPTGVQEINRFDNVRIDLDIVAWAEARIQAIRKRS